MKLLLSVLKLLAIFMLLAPKPSIAENQPSAVSMYLAGQTSEARKAFTDEVRAAAQSNNQVRHWQALMQLAWFEDELSQHRQAIEVSNQALEIASTIGDPATIGRSLCWLGWAYTGLGLYDLALQFYDNALELGAVDGKPRIVHVWGLATQEKGAILAKMGQLEEGKKLLLKTYTFAKKHGIDVGVAEGGAHLAEIALLQGDFSLAEQYAQAAVEAGTRCKCSMYNLLRAKTARLKVLREKLRTNESLRASFNQNASELASRCRKLQQTRCLAEVLLLQADLLPKYNFDERYAVVQEAFELMANSELELRGLAEAKLGRVFLDANKTKLAETYLQNGLEIEQSLFRQISAAHILSDLAALSGMTGKRHEQLQTLLTAAKDAKESQSLPLLLKLQRQTAHWYLESGNLSLAAQWYQNALQTVRSLRNQAFNLNRDNDLGQQELEITEQLIELGVSLQTYSRSQP